MSEQNKFFKASDAYGTTLAETTDQRTLEGRILLKSAAQLEALATRLKNGEQVSVADVGEALDYNQKLWTLFVSDTMNPDHPLPLDIKNNIASLGVFVFKRTREIMIDTTPEKFKILIDINRNIASGLMKQPANAALTAKKPAAPPQKGAESLTDHMA